MCGWVNNISKSSKCMLPGRGGSGFWCDRRNHTKSLWAEFVSPAARLYVQRYSQKALRWQGLKASHTKLEWFGVRVVRREKKRQGILKVNQLAKWRALISETSTRTLSEVIHSLAGARYVCLYSTDNILLCVFATTSKIDVDFHTLRSLEGRSSRPRAKFIDHCQHNKPQSTCGKGSAVAWNYDHARVINRVFSLCPLNWGFVCFA